MKKQKITIDRIDAIKFVQDKKRPLTEKRIKRIKELMAKLKDVVQREQSELYGLPQSTI